MPFMVKNLQPTSLMIALKSQTVGIGALGEAGPFEDEERSLGLAAFENRGDIATYDVPRRELSTGVSTPDEGQSAPKPRKSTVVEDKL